METYRILVREGMDWAEFMVTERPVDTTSDGHPRYSATWACVSSYGVFGHYWSHMGSPFPKFAAQIGPDYLLSKIAEKVFDRDRFMKWMRREIFTSRATREQKSDAYSSLRQLADEQHGESLAVMAYNDAAISHCDPEWSDPDTRSWDPQAVMFVERMWPGFVAALAERAAVAA